MLCPQYWPAAVQTPETYDSITVELLSVKTLENYNIRKLKVTLQTVRLPSPSPSPLPLHTYLSAQSQRKIAPPPPPPIHTQSEVSNSLVVHHYHYQSWSESKAPEHAEGIVELCERVMKVQMQSGNRPIVIHCRCVYPPSIPTPIPTPHTPHTPYLNPIPSHLPSLSHSHSFTSCHTSLCCYSPHTTPTLISLTISTNQ